MLKLSCFLYHIVLNLPNIQIKQMAKSRNIYRQPIIQEMTSVDLEPEQAHFIWKRAAIKQLSATAIIKEAFRKFVDHHTTVSSRGKTIQFEKEARTGYVHITCRIGRDLLTDVEYVYKAEKRRLNRSEACRIGINLLMKKPIKL